MMALDLDVRRNLLLGQSRDNKIEWEFKIVFKLFIQNIDSYTEAFTCADRPTLLLLTAVGNLI
jgi:hypothetical protein